MLLLSLNDREMVLSVLSFAGHHVNYNPIRHIFNPSLQFLLKRVLANQALSFQKRRAVAPEKYCECVSSLSLPLRLGINRLACSHEFLKYSLGRNELQDNTLQTFGLSVKNNGDYHAISASSVREPLGYQWQSTEARYQFPMWIFDEAT